MSERSPVSSYLCRMKELTPPVWLPYLRWAPVAIYFLVKYGLIGAGNITGKQSGLLIGFVILAEIAMWQYRKRFRPAKTQESDGTDQE